MGVWACRERQGLGRSAPLRLCSTAPSAAQLGSTAGSRQRASAPAVAPRRRRRTVGQLLSRMSRGDRLWLTRCRRRSSACRPDAGPRTAAWRATYAARATRKSHPDCGRAARLGERRGVHPRPAPRVWYLVCASVSVCSPPLARRPWLWRRGSGQTVPSPVLADTGWARTRTDGQITPRATRPTPKRRGRVCASQRQRACIARPHASHRPLLPIRLDRCRSPLPLLDAASSSAIIRVYRINKVLCTVRADPAAGLQSTAVARGTPLSAASAPMPRRTRGVRSSAASTDVVSGAARGALPLPLPGVMCGWLHAIHPRPQREAAGPTLWVHLHRGLVLRRSRSRSRSQSHLYECGRCTSSRARNQRAWA